MAEKRDILSQDDFQKSLISTIRAEEMRLQEALGKIEAQAAASIEQAQRETAELVRETKKSLPQWIETQRDSQLDQVQISAAHRRDSRPQRIEALQQTAARNMDATVDYICSGVLGASE